MSTVVIDLCRARNVGSALAGVVVGHDRPHPTVATSAPAVITETNRDGIDVEASKRRTARLATAAWGCLGFRVVATAHLLCRDHGRVRQCERSC
jgi:hypothetical protein